MPLPMCLLHRVMELVVQQRVVSGLLIVFTATNLQVALSLGIPVPRVNKAGLIQLLTALQVLFQLKG